MEKKNVFSDPKLAIIMAYAPAGLGHLRVTDALRHGLPSDAQPILLPTREDSIRTIHRIISVQPFFRKLMEWGQYGRPQDLVTRIYRRILVSESGKMEEQLYQIYKQRIELPHTLLVVASHFGIAHQVGKIKKHLEKRLGIRILVVVQVTDDSPQSIWYVPGADLITVPSEQTKEVLTAYGKTNNLGAVHMEVLPYPVSLHLGEKLSSTSQQNRRQQLSEKSDVPIHIVMPISGAAVGTMFVSSVTKELHHLSKRFSFHLVCKRNVFTEVFIQRMGAKDYVQAYSSHSDRQIVELYETAYTQTVVGLEITKPSEQAFKALLCSEQIGGSVLLFTDPVGRQENDNLAFLRRHQLIPTDEEQNLLFDLSGKNQEMSAAEQERLFPRAQTWRGVRIPGDPRSAAKFIWWCHQQGIFARMHECYSCARGDDSCKHELGDDGVKQFWKQVEKLL